MDEIKNIAFNDEISERVDRFLRREMSEAESKAFIEEVKTNSELKEYYLRQFNLMRGVKFHEMKELMKAKEMDLSTDRLGGSPISIGVFFHRYKYMLSTVAVAAAMVIGVFIWDNNRTKAVGTEALSVVWKSGDTIDNCIATGDFQKAIDLIDVELGKTYDLGEDSDALVAYTKAMNDLKYRKALVYLKMGKKRAAKAILKELNDSRSKEILDKLLW